MKIRVDSYTTFRDSEHCMLGIHLVAGSGSQFVSQSIPTAFRNCSSARASTSPPALAPWHPCRVLVFDALPPFRCAPAPRRAISTLAPPQIGLQIRTRQCYDLPQLCNREFLGGDKQMLPLTRSVLILRTTPMDRVLKPIALYWNGRIFTL